MSQEFRCVECGRHVVRMVKLDTTGLCAACIFMPGWFRDPELRKVLDPDLMQEDLPEHER